MTMTFNDVLEETLYTYGYNCSFLDLSFEQQKRLAAYALYDSQFDMYEIMTERDIDIPSLIKDAMIGSIKEDELSGKIIEAVVLNLAKDIEDKLQDLIYNMKEEYGCNDYSSKIIDEIFFGGVA